MKHDEYRNYEDYIFLALLLVAFILFLAFIGSVAMPVGLVEGLTR